MNIYEFLLEKASSQLESLTPKSDGKWFDDLTQRLNLSLQDASLDGTTKQAAIEALGVLVKNKNLVIGLGLHTFTLLTYQVAIGKANSALENYIKAIGNADELIALMNSGTDGVIKAKKHLDEMNANAHKLVYELLATIGRVLLPFLLSSI